MEEQRSPKKGRDNNNQAECCAAVCTYVRVLFDRHKQFFLQVDDGSYRLGQLQGGSVHKAIHCVAVHVLTDSVDF